jgi:hypothetical protein
MQASAHVFRNDEHIHHSMHYQQLQEQVKAANNGSLGDIDMEDHSLMRSDHFGMEALQQSNL